MFHLTSPEISFFDQSDQSNKVRLHKKFALNLGLSAPLGDDDQLMVYGDYFTQVSSKYKRIGISSIQAALMLNHSFYVLGDERKSLSVGAIYRLADAVAPVIRLELGRFNIGASYDVNISQLTTASHARGGFELTLCYSKALNYRNSELRQTICPRFGRGY
jgi:predicted amidohydrolase